MGQYLAKMWTKVGGLLLGPACRTLNIACVDIVITWCITWCVVCQGGSVIQLHHKVLQSFLVAEGLFDDCLTEDSQ